MLLVSGGRAGRGFYSIKPKLFQRSFSDAATRGRGNACRGAGLAARIGRSSDAAAHLRPFCAALICENVYILEAAAGRYRTVCRQDANAEQLAPPSRNCRG
jgi:hypothetical protein